MIGLRAFRSIGLMALATVAGGCVGYQLGDSTPLPFHSIHVVPPVNTSTVPQSAALLGTALIREFDRSGRVRIETATAAEAVLNVTITGLRRESSADRADDTGLARKWRVTLSAECTLLNPRSDKPWFERRTISAFDEVYADSGLVAAEYQNMPVLAGRLAEAISREVLGVW